MNEAQASSTHRHGTRTHSHPYASAHRHISAPRLSAPVEDIRAHDSVHDEHEPDEHGHGHQHGHEHSDHDHGHQHGHEHPRGLKGAVLEIFAPHSHDAADSLDTALESSTRGIRAVKISFVALMATSIVQVAVIIASGSVALLADTIHNFSDALTAIPLFIAFRLSRRPPTRRYTYGYGRAEDLAGLFVILMITLSAIIAAAEAIRRLISPQTVDYLGNELVALYRIREGRAIGSAALTADGWHARTDGFTSLAVVIGALGVWAGFPAADPIAGLVISIAILAVLRTAARDVLRRLMNGVDPALVDRLEHAASAVSGVTDVSNVQVRWEGHRLQADLSVTAPNKLDVVEAHQLAHAVEHQLLHNIPHLDAVAVHVEPDSPERDGAHDAARDHH
jgi:cation diffusion facilitator family transporter